jgi:photosystem II stability/assembly factor-like uncharacterized protein
VKRTHQKGLMLGILSAFLVLLVVLGMALPNSAQENNGAQSSNPFAQLRYREVGPGGNRVAAVVGEPGNPLVIYAGASDGGIWKTTDGGINWKAVFDHQDVSSIGSLAIAPSAHNIVWAGTGESWIIRAEYSMGDGIYKSTDSGMTWHHMGLDLTGHIDRIVINPKDPNIVFACAVGQAYRPQHERGIFRTTDGGKTWKQVLFVNENTGCSELSMDPHDPQTIFAGMWQVAIHTWDLDSGGPGSGVYVTHDGGDTWTKLSGHGLPPADQPLGKTAVQVTPSDSNRVYALIQESTPRLYRSEDRGRTWKVVNQLHILDERSPYYTRFAVAPNDENFLFFVAVSISYSRDGGVTLANDIPKPAGDVHDIWYDPLNPDRVMIAHDHGISVSLNREKSWQTYEFPIAQMYHVFTDNRVPYFVYGNRQDEPTFRGPSNNLQARGFSAGRMPSYFGGLPTSSAISAADWTQIGGCEPGFSIPDPVDQDIVWSGCYDGDLTRMDLRSGQARWVSPRPEGTYGWTPKDVKYRWNWTLPIAISPHDHNRVYVGSQYVHETDNGGQSWHVISPDLTLNDKSHEQDSGGISVDNLMTFEGATLFSIAESPVQAGVIWTGSTDGQVNVTKDGGKTWTNVTKNISNLPPWGTIWQVTPSRFDAGRAYIVDNLEQGAGDYNAYVYETDDFGKTWKFISAGIPKSMNSSGHTIVEDPVRPGMLFLGTDNFIYVTWDDGAHWTRLRNNMPPAPIYWLTIQKHYDDLVVATYGRGIWILDDITALREWDKVQQSTVYFFKPRPAYRYRSFNSTHAIDTYNHAVGENPPDGADLNYYLKTPAKKVEITILGPHGQVIRTMAGTAKPGINRVWWDLRYDAPTVVKLRMSPPGEPWVKTGPEGWRPLVHWRNYTHGPRVWPGTYTVKLDVDGQQFTEPLTILRDPHDLGTQQDIEANTQFLLQLCSEMNDSADMINRLEWSRKQLAQLEDRLAGDPQHDSVLQAAKALEQKLEKVEEDFFPLALTGRTEDAFRVPTRLYGQLTNVAFLVEGGADLPPTDQSVAFNKELEQQLAQAKQQFQQLGKSAIPQFNTLLQSNGLSGIEF